GRRSRERRPSRRPPYQQNHAGKTRRQNASAESRGSSPAITPARARPSCAPVSVSRRARSARRRRPPITDHACPQFDGSVTRACFLPDEGAVFTTDLFDLHARRGDVLRPGHFLRRPRSRWTVLTDLSRWYVEDLA